MLFISRTKCEKIIYKILSKAFTNVKTNINFSSASNNDKSGNFALTFSRNYYDFRYEGYLKINDIEYNFYLTKKMYNPPPSLILQLNKREICIDNYNEMFKTIDKNLQNIKEI